MEGMSATTDQPTKRVLLAAPRGCYAGVDRAVVTVEGSGLYGPPVYVRKQIVHNKHVVRTLEKQAIFVEETDEVPEVRPSSSPRTVSPRRPREARQLSLRPLMRPPLVTRHREAVPSPTAMTFSSSATRAMRRSSHRR